MPSILLKPTRAKTRFVLLETLTRMLTRLLPTRSLEFIIILRKTSVLWQMIRVCLFKTWEFMSSIFLSPSVRTFSTSYIFNVCQQSLLFVFTLIGVPFFVGILSYISLVRRKRSPKIKLQNGTPVARLTSSPALLTGRQVQTDSSSMWIQKRQLEILVPSWSCIWSCYDLFHVCRYRHFHNHEHNFQDIRTLENQSFEWKSKMEESAGSNQIFVIQRLLSSGVEMVFSFHWSYAIGYYWSGVLFW